MCAWNNCTCTVFCTDLIWKLQKSATHLTVLCSIYSLKVNYIIKMLLPQGFHTYVCLWAKRERNGFFCEHSLFFYLKISNFHSTQTEKNDGFDVFMFHYICQIIWLWFVTKNCGFIHLFITKILHTSANCIFFHNNFAML